MVPGWVQWSEFAFSFVAFCIASAVVTISLIAKARYTGVLPRIWLDRETDDALRKFEERKERRLALMGELEPGEAISGVYRRQLAKGNYSWVISTTCSTKSPYVVVSTGGRPRKSHGMPGTAPQTSSWRVHRMTEAEVKSHYPDWDAPQSRWWYSLLTALGNTATRGRV